MEPGENGEKRRPRGRPAREISPEKAKEAVWASAARMVAAKDWPEKGLRDRLREKFAGLEGVEAIAEEVARKMAALGIVDDERFARGFLRQRLQRKARKLAAREALAKGISEETLERALADIDAESEEGGSEKSLERSVLENIWMSKFKGCLPKDERERQKQGRFLASRGFAFGEIQSLWKRAKNGEIGQN